MRAILTAKLEEHALVGPGGNAAGGQADLYVNSGTDLHGPNARWVKAPTLPPKTRPTKSPTKSPTDDTRPTPKPTPMPTKRPTKSPTSGPPTKVRVCLPLACLLLLSCCFLVLLTRKVGTVTATSLPSPPA